MTLRAAVPLLAALAFASHARRAGAQSADSLRAGAALAPRAAPPARPPDAWLGADKARHYVVSGFTLGVAHGALTAAGVERRPALVGAAAAALAVGVGKELYDRGHRGRPSLRDLAWDVAGAATWAALVARTGR